RVRRIQQHGKSIGIARAGSRAAIALANLDVNEVSRGSVIVNDFRWRTTSLFEAVLRLDPAIAATLTARTRLRLHAGAAEVGAQVTSSYEQSAQASGTLVRIATDAPLALRGGDRFVARLPAPVRTVGGGVVIDPYARRRPLSHPLSEELEALSRSSAAAHRFGERVGRHRRAREMWKRVTIWRMIFALVSMSRPASESWFHATVAQCLDCFAFWSDRGESCRWRRIAITTGIPSRQ